MAYGVNREETQVFSFLVFNGALLERHCYSYILMIYVGCFCNRNVKPLASYFTIKINIFRNKYLNISKYMQHR